MKRKYHDITGNRYGRLVVVCEAEKDPSRKHRGKLWKCLCDCGNEVIVRADSLKTVQTGTGVKSCGCLQRDRTKESQTKHGFCGTRLYIEWANLKNRCWYPTHPSYQRYGGKGINICEEWLDFEAFKDWALSSGYSDSLTLDRIDNDGMYEPSNCRWVSATIQSFNKGIAAKNNTGVTGVRFRKDRNAYVAFIGVDKKQVHLGTFKTLEEARHARAEAEARYYPGIKQN